MTELNEIEKMDHLQMNLVEFIEALARAADRIDQVGKVKILTIPDEKLLDDPIGYWYYLEEKTEEEY